jgi:CheY-like chemotaxis protein
MIPVRNIMLIDDSKIDLFVNQKIIERFDKSIRVIHFDAALKALEYLKISLHERNLNHFTRPNVLFLDINMPKCNGFEFLDLLAKNEYLEIHNLRIIILSSSTSLKDITRAKEHPLCSGYFSKPLTSQKLYDAINVNKDYLTLYDQIDEDSSA